MEFEKRKKISYFHQSIQQVIFVKVHFEDKVENNLGKVANHVPICIVSMSQ